MARHEVKLGDTVEAAGVTQPREPKPEGALGLVQGGEVVEGQQAQQAQQAQQQRAEQQPHGQEQQAQEQHEGVQQAPSASAQPPLLILVCSELRVAQRWRDAHPGETFRPQPLGAHGPSDRPTRAAARLTAQGGGAQQRLLQPCKYWLNEGHCAKGAACPFAHHAAGSEALAAKAQWVRDRRAQRRKLATDAGDPHARSGGAQRKSQRAKQFAAFVSRSLGGPQTLNEGSGVLDVAGGRGAVAFELIESHGVRTTVIDPRPARLTKQQHKRVKARGGAKGSGVPDSISACLTPQLWQAPQPASGGSGEAQEQEQEQGQGGIDPAIVARIRSCSAVVGMHPDQATDAIVDLACELGLPFALAPCCVFPRLFDHRRLPQDDAESPGGRVETREQLIRYLCHRADDAARRRGHAVPPCEVTHLPFEGANAIVFRRPPGLPPATTEQPTDENTDRVADDKPSGLDAAIATILGE